MVFEILAAGDLAENHRLGDPPLLRPDGEVNVRNHKTDETDAANPYVTVPIATGMGIARNISAGGLFVETRAPQPIGGGGMLGARLVGRKCPELTPQDPQR